MTHGAILSARCGHSVRDLALPLVIDVRRPPEHLLEATTDMAKRSRGSTRPGQRPSSQRPAQRQAARSAAPRVATPSPARPDALTEAEEARAAELEAALVAEERVAEASRSRARERGRAEPAFVGRARTREGSLLAARAEEEYAYVVRDVKRIVRVGGGLIGILAILFVLIDVAKVIRI